MTPCEGATFVIKPYIFLQDDEKGLSLTDRALFFKQVDILGSESENINKPFLYLMY